MNSTLTRRAVTAQDDEFLFELFKWARLGDLAALLLPPATIEGLMRVQYVGQKQTYRAQYSSGDEIVLVNGKPVGRIWVYRGPAEHHLVDIALLPEYRNRGIGAALVSEAVSAARAAGVALRCSVAVNNPGSLRFHQRLGFRIVARDELYFALAAEP